MGHSGQGLGVMGTHLGGGWAATLRGGGQSSAVVPRLTPQARKISTWEGTCRKVRHHRRHTGSHRCRYQGATAYDTARQPWGRGPAGIRRCLHAGFGPVAGIISALPQEK